MVLALNIHVLFAWTRTWWSPFPKKRGKTILHLLRSLSTSINSGFVACSHLLPVLNISSSKMNAAKTVSSDFWSFVEFVSPRKLSNQMLWIEVLNCCFASLMAEMMVGLFVRSVTSVVFVVKAKEIKSGKSKLYQRKGLMLSGTCTLY